MTKSRTGRSEELTSCSEPQSTRIRHMSLACTSHSIQNLMIIKCKIMFSCRTQRRMRTHSTSHRLKRLFVCVEFVFFFLLRYFFHKMSSAPQSTIIQTSKHDTAIFWCWLQLHHTVKKQRHTYQRSIYLSVYLLDRQTDAALIAEKIVPWHF